MVSEALFFCWRQMLPDLLCNFCSVVGSRRSISCIGKEGSARCSGMGCLSGSLQSLLICIIPVGEECSDEGSALTRNALVLVSEKYLQVDVQPSNRELSKLTEINRNTGWLIGTN
jgi:hypothetical protein